LYIGPLAQLAEQLTLNQLVEGSSPSRLTQHLRGTLTEGRAIERGSSVACGQIAFRSAWKNGEF
jgi:hypothetical protein